MKSSGQPLAVGGSVAGCLRRGGAAIDSDLIAGIGLALILGPMAASTESVPSPGLLTTLPVAGTALILVSCRSGLVHRVLSWRPLVFVGLISYSVYLWHQPLYAFWRILNPRKPEPWEFGLLMAPTLVLAALSWRFVEVPCRRRHRISSGTLMGVLASAAVVFVSTGLFIHLEGGFPQRLPIAPAAPPPGSYIQYNRKVFAEKRDSFSVGKELRLLVIGNSTARDFVNVAREARQFDDYEIVYRDDVDLCRPGAESKVVRGLIRSATLIVAVGYRAACRLGERSERSDVRGKIVFVGPRDFGHNLNPFARMPLNRRKDARTEISEETLEQNEHQKHSVPSEIYVDFIRHLSSDGRTVPVFDEAGRMLSEDRAHLTRPGAIFAGKLIFTDPVWDHVAHTAALRAASEEP